MSQELLHLLQLVEQGIEVNDSQMKHCQNMQRIINEDIAPGMNSEHLLSAGAILGWGLGTSATYVKNNIDKLIRVLKTLDLDLTALEDANNIEEKAPGGDVNIFVEEYLEKARMQMEALQGVKSQLLRDDFDVSSLDNLYSDKGRALLQEDFEKELNRLLEDKDN